MREGGRSGEDWRSPEAEGAGEGSETGRSSKDGGGGVFSSARAEGRGFH